ncbi:bifunctional folylpolyglutamate synthase/dihydrofolate synthase [Bacillus mangrovi]|uniref:Dihydrofolate synthase/folylpolyglutamate synthase n=1 Tax=Metabacillus mangrovi TaxID=1491830 RepID=A0A7X2S493_9BACI|nr:folylpolyglutamate synthase/dihydrofolate synthase family protein [Metabacillus mangrovi]MTH52958.1 bifunctional folylpolyglutamate synthase/dihydrofolate synthase [Metabacillus mangrovi]
MLHTYEEALHWIHSRLRFGIKPGLERMQGMMEKLGDPHLNVPVIHVAGTNGKGSTVSYMRSMLNEAGYKAGTFTSPYLESFNERISMDGMPVSSADLVSIANKVKPAAEAVEAETGEAPTEFEIITAMAFYYFGEVNRPDFLLLEAGLGGRLDSTNITEPVLSVITNIGYDHMNILGSSIEEIAFEKAGIIKQGIPVVTGAEKGKGLQQIKEKAAERQSEIYALGADFFITKAASNAEGERFSLAGTFGKWDNLQISMFGAHQTGNASLALAALSLMEKKGHLKLDKKAAETGLLKAAWSGRYEIFSRSPRIILDGAHNKEGAASLADTLKRHEAGRKIHLLFTALEDKEYKSMLDILGKAADCMYVTQFDFPRAAESDALFQACQSPCKSAVPDWKAFLDSFPLQLKKDETLVICGSLYFVSEARSHLKVFG